MKSNKNNTMDEDADIIPIDLGPVKAFLIRGEKNFLVDAGNPGDAEDILDEVMKEGVEPDDIDSIIITHVHPDHAGSLHELKEKTRARVVVHEKEAENIARGDFLDAPPTCLKGRILSFFLSIFGSGESKGTEPDILVGERFDLSELGINGSVVHTPGHTPGSISVVLDSGEALVGDLVMGGLLLSSSKPNRPIFAYDLEGAERSLKRLLKGDVKIRKFYGAHGGPFPRDKIVDLVG
ncbi:MAG: MBL fold metallo-hydrolase [Candidatus Thermoplasmatota archaeon]|nr:MBL fold metallo-hydrolase [Candidatus Thermoplasmatota archaeon]